VFNIYIDAVGREKARVNVVVLS